ncbi:MAG: c-type cytochrome biogenesis protein CcsB, partial [Nitrospirae bacterium]|nr:c-type cytochrome biogenesis protein CcsB [Nitrospirota bacterium]
MVQSLLLFDMTFWLYLAAFALYVGYIFARRPGRELAPAGHPTSGMGESDEGWS